MDTQTNVINHIKDTLKFLLHIQPTAVLKYNDLLMIYFLDYKLVINFGSKWIDITYVKQDCFSKQYEVTYDKLYPLLDYLLLQVRPYYCY